MIQVDNNILLPVAYDYEEASFLFLQIVSLV